MPDPLGDPEQSLVTPARELCTQLCSRRAVLVAGAGLVGSALLAACSSGGHRRLADVGPGAANSADNSLDNSVGSQASAPGSTDPTTPIASSSASAPSTPAPTSSPRSAAGTSSASRHPTTSGTTSSGTTSSGTTSSGTTTTPAPSTRSSTPTKSSAPPTQSTPTPTQPAGTVLAQLAAVPVGGSLVVNGPRGPVAIGRPSSNRVVAHTAICTHMGCTVEANGARLNCPCHGSIYDAFSGTVIQTPAPLPLAAISVRIAGTAVVTP
jgi:Rieske Fe-S protein